MRAPTIADQFSVAVTESGTTFVMGNAADPLKARGYRLTGTHDAGGLADAVRACLAMAKESR